MTDASVATHGLKVTFTLDEDELESRRTALEGLTEKQRVLLNQWAHEPSFFHERTLPDDLPYAYRAALANLRSGPLLDESEEGLVVPDDVLYLPGGPGVRANQLPGLFHRLDEEVLRDWYKTLTDDDSESLPEWLLYRRLASAVANQSSHAVERLTEVWPERATPWCSPGDLDGDVPETISGFYSELTPEGSALEACLLGGLVLPLGNEEGAITALALESSYRDRSTSNQAASTTREDHREVDWERKPFTPAEQMKFLMIASDAVPFRLTRDGDPHQFDLKEVARVSEWSTEHLEFLTRFLLENGYLSAGDERFYMTERGQEWDQGNGTLRPFFTRFGPPLFEEGEGPGPAFADLSMGRLFEKGLRLLDHGEGHVRADQAVDCFLTETILEDFVLTFTPGDRSLEECRQRLAEVLFESLHELGMTDRLEDDEAVFYRLNERGEELLGSGSLRAPEHEQLPYILQPDGQLLVPLESPLEEFRRLNPFALLVKVDRMIGYQIDRQSLVQALNDGWDAGSFLNFLRGKTESIPDPLQDLFEDTIGNVKSINVEEVHHLIEFEDGATAAKAANILNNYDPRRINENTIVLRSETSPRTIRRNLSRGGIRLSGGDVDAGQSPLMEAPDDGQD